jgi:hypothetical protein
MGHQNKKTTSMSSALDQYRQAKADVVKLEEQAREELITRFHDLQSEIERIRKELREFGVKTVPKASSKKQARNTKQRRASTRQSDVKAAPIDSAKIRRLQKQIDNLREKAALAKAPEEAKRLADRVYELEDELRLTKEALRVTS